MTSETENTRLPKSSAASEPALPLGNIAKDGDSTLEGTTKGNMMSAKHFILPDSVAAFVRKFYEKKQPSEQLKKTFSDLPEGLSDAEIKALRAEILYEDPELNKTLILAEFLLQDSCRRSYREQLVNLIAEVAGNVGTLAKNPRNDVFTTWKDDFKGSANMLQKFNGNIARIRLDTDNELPKRLKNNLISLAAIWLYHKEEIDLAKLIRVLRDEGLSLQGQSGDSVNDGAFGFVASMIRSTNKKRFSYFLDWVGKNESDSSKKIRDLELHLERTQRLLAAKESEVERMNLECDVMKNQLSANDAELLSLGEKNNEMEQKLFHREIHHDADQRSNKSRLDGLFRQLLKIVGDAQHALDGNKEHIVRYQLEELESQLRRNKL